MATNTEKQRKHEVGQAFVERHQSEVIGVLHGWDRLRLQGTLRSLYYAVVMEQYLRKAGVLWKDFKKYAIGLTGRVCQAVEELGKQCQRPVIYLASSQASKEDEARRIQQRDGIKSGLIAVISCVEPCRMWRMRGNHETQRLELRLEWGKCKHLYFYWLHEELGFLHMRLQTWFPFLIQFCVNGREWLGRQMDKEGMAYRQEDNCFPWIADVGRAQELMEEQHRTDWPKVLGELVKRCHPVHEEISRSIELEYYWTAAQSEYATDVMFRDRGALERIYSPLVHHAVMHMGAEQVMRYMGRSGRVGINDAVVTDRRRRSEGVRVKHWLNKNSLKFYDKGSVLRDETTINEPKDFRVWRRAENKPQSKPQWRVLRRSVADFGRRAEVSRKATDRHLTALAAVEIDNPLAQEAAQVCRPVRRERQRHRALNPMGEADAELMAAVNRGEYAINGFRNRDVRARLYAPTSDKRKEHQRMGAVGRKLRLLRGHGLIAKVPKTHRYVVTEKGRRIITALLAARQASTEKLTAMAA
ncbi:MAG: hypothetical protein Q8S00_22110 [Deltaproteobacteria bacterium]|nr:hypothetical protein [Deltaproteobacteria bacterium]MDZ4341898.1 hypothetical protein [Candidatus Binatia bacterium]